MIFQYLYFKIYRFFKSINGTNDIPDIKALIVITLLYYFNIFEIWSILFLNFDVPFFIKGELSISVKLLIGLIMASIFILNYIFFVKDDKTTLIEGTFRKESKFSFYLGNLLVVCYMIGTFLLLFFLGHLVRLK